MAAELKLKSIKDLKSISREYKKVNCKPYSKLNKSQLMNLIIFYDLPEKTDMNKRSIKDLKNILREHKKIHCKPYSKLNKDKLIEFIVFHNIHRNTNVIDRTPLTKPKVKKPTKKETDEMRLQMYKSELHKLTQRIKFNTRGTNRVSPTMLMDDFNKVNDKIEKLTGKKNIVLGINEDPKLMKKRLKIFDDSLKPPKYTKEERDRLDASDKERQQKYKKEGFIL